MDDLSEEFECHFTWNFINLEKRRELYLRDRINTIKKELSSQNEGAQQQKRNLPQLYSLKGYLYAQLYQKTDDDGEEFLTEAETHFNKALKECKDENIGYRSVIYADLIHLKRQKWGHGDTIEFTEKFRSVSQDHPEILAMKGYAASLFHSYEVAIQFYERALSQRKTAEWVFGLALAMQNRNIGRNRNELKQIEDLFREVLTLDSTYDMARLKLAKELWNNEDTSEAKKKEIHDLLEGIDTNQDNTTLLVKKAALLRYYYPNTELAETLLIKARERHPNSHEILRELGKVYFKRWNAKRSLESNLEEAIEYYTKSVGTESQNAMPFDLTMIGIVHLKASNYYRHKKAMQCKYREHQEKCQKWFKKAEQRLSKEQYDLRDSIETCFRLSQYYNHIGELETEKKYLRVVLKKANEGSEEDKFHELKFFKEAKERFLEIANGESYEF